MPISLSIILASYNTCAMTLDCLEKLTARLSDLESAKSEIWVVDNASTDGSAQEIPARFPEVRFIASGHNLGFGAANNLAIQRSQGDLILLLNTDAFLQNDALISMIKYLDKHPKMAAVGPRLLNEDRSHQDSVFASPTVGEAWFNILGSSRLKSRVTAKNLHRTGAIEKHSFLKGACILLRREVWETIGGFDERFFFYMEDIDWCDRVMQGGHDIGYLDEAEVLHLSGKSSANWLAPLAFFNSAMEYYIWKRQGSSGVRSLHASWIFYAIRMWIREFLVMLLGRKKPDPKIRKLCRWLIKFALTSRTFDAPDYTTRIQLPKTI